MKCLLLIHILVVFRTATDSYVTGTVSTNFKDECPEFSNVHSSKNQGVFVKH